LILFGRWKVTLPPEEWIWEPDEVSFSDMLLLENESGQSYKDWIRQGVGQERAEATQILIWFLRRKADPTYQQERYAVDPPNIRHFEMVEIPKAEVDVDPEAPAVSETATSSPSSTATVSGPPNGVLSVAATS
jgi:hypothetical protein